MGNANGREDDGAGSGDDPSARSQSDSAFPGDYPEPFAGRPDRSASLGSMDNTPPESPGRSRSPLMFSPQVPLPPLHRDVDVPPVFNQIWMEESGFSDSPQELGIPTLITWNYGGNEVYVEGSWDNWTMRRALQRSGKDFSILMVLPSGIYQYGLIVDGEWRYIHDLPYVTNEGGHITNVLDVHDYVPENLESVSEFEAPPSPESSYGQPLPVDEDFAKAPPVVPPQLHMTVLGDQDIDAATKPHHVVLNHLFIEKGGAPQSLVGLGSTHRFQSKYITVVLYKPLRR